MLLCQIVLCTILSFKLSLITISRTNLENHYIFGNRFRNKAQCQIQSWPSVIHRAALQEIMGDLLTIYMRGRCRGQLVISVGTWGGGGGEEEDKNILANILDFLLQCVLLLTPYYAVTP